MTKLIAVSAFVLALLVAPASGLAAPPPEGSDPVLTISPSPVGAADDHGRQPVPERRIPAPQRKRRRSRRSTRSAIEGEDAGDFSLSAAPTAAAARSSPASTARLWVALKAEQRRLKKTTSAASASQAGRPEQGFEVSGSSVEPQLTFSPPSYDFGLQRVYENRNTYLQLTNSGEATVQLNNFEVQRRLGLLLDRQRRLLEPVSSSPARAATSKSTSAPRTRVAYSGRTAGDRQRLRLHRGAQRRRRAGDHRSQPEPRRLRRSHGRRQRARRRRSR